ncbi:dimethyl sulfoxide reductase subunit A [Eggerthella sinensis]|uniref:Dimethyl sulfoxide reductase subunit A n=2 Tax=Eggerthella sinensis TaxID=242230 RepID=A0A3N0IX25_9ACTN|nr:dimethyl sulfoxide reductase subunit A [Eggerthella sinensis]RNM41485.1 dimethyl sulfoxide reductase subunit A [Eggerthella sinensis]
MNDLRRLCDSFDMLIELIEMSIQAEEKSMGEVARSASARGISRRGFVGASAAAALLLASGCAPENKLKKTEETEEQRFRLDAELDEAVSGEWKAVPCWHSCGGKCLLKAYVVDGVVTRVKTDDVYDDSLETFQNRACPRGRSQRMTIFGADRLKYPMKRKNWQPGGGENVNGELRGVDEWERISWDEAIELTAKEMRRIYDTHGGRSVLFANYGRTQAHSKLLAAMGGYTNFTFTDSYGSNFLYTGEMGGNFGHSEAAYSTNDRLDLLNAEVISFQGGNPGWASGGTPLYNFYRAKQSGAEFIYIGPEYNVTASTLEAKWIPIRPATDTAFLLGVAHEMLRLDQEQGDVVDWDFIGKYTVGFTMDSLPEDASVEECFYGYVMGEYDGTPKTAEWASEICGAPAEDIAWYAEKIGKTHAATMIFSYAPSRCNGAESFPQMMMTIGSMGGHMGKPGHACGPQYHFWASNDGPALITPGSMRDMDLPKVLESIGGFDTSGEAGASYLGGSAIPNRVDDVILTSFMWSAVVDGKYTYFGNVVDRSKGLSLIEEPEEREIDIRMIWSDMCNFITTRQNTNLGIEAYRKVDFAVSTSYVFTPAAQFSDIVFPCTTPWEGPGYDEKYPMLFSQQNRESFIIPHWAVAPLYEAKSERDIQYLLLEALGFEADLFYPASEEQRHFDRIVNTTVLDEDGKTWVPLVTITQEDLDEVGLEGKVQEGKIGYKELMEAGVYHVPRKEGDNYGFIAFKDFVDDPEANPRPYTKSGKIELYCQEKLNILNRLGFSKEPQKPYVDYHKPKYGYEETFEDWDNKVKGAYPLQVFNGHYLRRSHTSFDAVGCMREAYKNPVFMNADDAAERGLQDGDWVRIFNQNGEVLRQVSALETMMPGVVNLPHGSWPEIDPDLGISVNGGTNFLTDSTVGDSCVQGYNTVLVEIEKYEKQDILPDEARPVVVPKGIEE